MPRNGSGVYSAPSNKWNPPVAGQDMDATDWQSTLDDIESAISASIASDGQTTASARIPFAAGTSAMAGAVTGVSYSFTSDPNTGIYSPAADKVGVVAGGTEIVRAESGQFSPVANNTIDLGSSSYKFKNAYFQGNLSISGTVNGLFNGTFSDAEISALAGLTSAANKVPMFSGSGTATLLDFKDEDDMASNSATAVPSQQSVKAYVDSSVFPSGVLVPYGGTAAPTGWLLCYGQAISRTTYAALFTAIGTTYGSGDGSTTFNVPDLRGRVIAGQDDMGGTSANRLTGLSGGIDGDVLGTTGGGESCTLTEANLPSALTVSAGTGDSGTGSYIRSSGLNNQGTQSFSLSSVGSDTAINIVQPTIILNYIIKT